MTPSPFAPLKFVQVCYVVPHLEQACADFRSLYGIGPFLGGGTFSLQQHVYRGTPAAPIVLRGAMAQSGDVNVELLELVSTGPSAFRDMFPAGQGLPYGVHHTAVFCDDYTKTRDHFVSEGMALASEFETDFGARICYVDARARLGHMLELYPENAVIRGMYARVRDAAKDWDGSRLIVPW